jgi:CheY-like chemotaxis protein/two-component sensor histidine kinase
LAMLSHELRNPLPPIANAVQLLRLQKDEAPIQRQARTIIERQVAQLTRLVDDLMEVSRISTGRVQLRLERAVVNSIVERAVESARPLIDRHEHELTVALSPQPIWLYADAARLEQVVVNLLNNAAKYTKDGGRISLTVLREGDECVLRLRDTGVGIAPELLPRIFDLFTQAERSLDRSQGGLGIGLALVQRLVELHRGRVEAISVLGRGSEFVVRLPVPLSDAPQPAPAPAEASPPTGPSLRVLVVDDNVDTAESMAMLLKASGHDTRTAHDGPTGLKAVIDYGPDVVLLDIGLPELDGFQVAKRIREHPKHKNAVLVAMTGYGQEADCQQSREAGFDHHLVKPADFGKVQQILATISEKARPH